MDFVRGIAIWGLIALAAAFLGGLLAGVKNRDYSFWIAWCLVLPPMLIVLLLLPRHEGPRPRQPSLDTQDRRDGWL
jgi:hypothetical protein